MHHKRGRTRSRRAGCKLCKPWKLNGWRFADHRRRRAAKLDLDRHLCGRIEAA